MRRLVVAGLAAMTIMASTGPAVSASDGPGGHGDEACAPADRSLAQLGADDPGVVPGLISLVGDQVKHLARGTMTLEVLEYDRPYRLHNVLRSSYMQVDGALTFEHVDDGTRLRWDWEMGLIGPTRVFSPLLALIGPGRERQNWMGLKQYMESSRR